MEDYLFLFLIVFGVNLMPAFGPPTWTILVVYRLNTDIPTWLLVLIGAGAAACGRLVLAHTFRLFGRHLPQKSRQNLAAARAALERNRRSTIVALGLFAISPVPSAQLFEAAGLAGMRLLGFTAAFFAGRIVSYTIYAYGAGRLRDTSWGEELQGGFSNPWIIALQVALIAALVAMTRIKWAKVLGRPSEGCGDQPSR
jgi:uncharacterized membrane protein YdjX (TVP38/TMEM64 family)